MTVKEKGAVLATRLLTVLSLTLLFFLLIMLVQVCRLQFGYRAEPIEWHLQIGQGEAVPLPQAESTGQSTPSVNLRRLADLMHLRIQGEVGTPTVLAPSVGGGAESRITFVNGSNVVTINGEKIVLGRAVVATQGEIYVELSFLQNYFAGLEITCDVQSGVICVAQSGKDAPACKVPLES